MEYVSDDLTSAIIICYNMAEYLEGSIPQRPIANVLKLRGLDPEASYKIPELGDTVYKGDFLMNIGIPWPVKGAYKSLILEVRKSEK